MEKIVLMGRASTVKITKIDIILILPLLGFFRVKVFKFAIIFVSYNITL